MGNWLVTQPNTNDGLSTTATTQQTITRDLPKSNFLTRYNFKLHIIGVGTPTLTLDRIRVQASGSVVLFDLNGGMLRGINKYQNGSVNNGAAVSTTDLVWVGSLNFGRGYHDELMILPGKGFKQLTVTFIYTPGAGTSVTSVALTATAEELISDDDPKSKLIRRLILEGTRASAASDRFSFELTPGLPVRAIYMQFDDPDNVNANTPVYGGTVAAPDQIRVLLNGGSEIPYAASADMIKLSNQEQYRFDDADTPDTEVNDAAAFTGTAEQVCLDFDPLDNLESPLKTGLYNRIQVEIRTAASGQSGSTYCITDAYMVL